MTLPLPPSWPPQPRSPAWPPCSPPHPRPGRARWLAPSLRGFIALLLLMAGVQCWIVLGGAQWPEKRPLLAAAAAALAGGLAFSFERTRAAAMRAMRGLAQPSPAARLTIATALFIGSALYLYGTARSQGRSFVPIIHDEHAYLLQSRMLAGGRLWMERHPMADFFDSFHLITDRVYAAKYSPGTALFYAPALKAGLPHWVMPLLLVAASVALAYLVLSLMVDGVAGLLGAMMLPALPLVRRISIEALSQGPMLFLALLAVWAYLQWRKGSPQRTPAFGASPDPAGAEGGRRTGWIALAGAAIGWGAITRPVDALALAIPLAVAVLLDLRGQDRRAWIRTLAAGILPMLPFLALQLVCNKGITGSLTRLPWNYYAQKDDPYDTLSSAPFDPALRPMSKLPQKQLFFDEFTAAQYKAKLGTRFASRLLHGRLEPTLSTALPAPILLTFVPLALLGLACRRRWVLAAMLGIFVLLYTPYTFFLAHYAIAVTAGAILLVVAGWDALAMRLPRLEGPIRLVGAAGIGALILAGLPQLQRQAEPDEWPLPPVLRQVHDRLAKLEKTPALVLFRFDPETSNPHCEPVYNIDSPWPDDARIIRAHDLEEKRNRELFGYYAQRSPGRAVYLYNRSAARQADPITYLGTVSELAGK